MKMAETKINPYNQEYNSPQSKILLKNNLIMGLKNFRDDHLVQKSDFLLPDDNGAKITLGYPDPTKWDLVEVFSKYFVAVSHAHIKKEDNPGIPLLIQPYKGRIAALFRKML